MFNYFVYGLHIASELELPEFMELDTSAIDSEPDITVQWGDARPFVASQPLVDDYYQTQDGDFYFSWELSGSYLVEQGNRITIQPRPEIEESATRIPLCGVVMATLLSQRGLLVMHASAIEIAGQAVAFVGHKGQGKSTMSAALHGLGYPLVADDVVAIHFDATGQPTVTPGIPMFKLWPDAVEAAFQEDPESLAKVHPVLEKRARLAKENFSSRPLPLETLYVLETAESIELSNLVPQAAMAQLFVHSYMARFGNRLLQGAAGEKHFKACTHFLANTEICSLKRPRDLTLLPAIAQQVIERAMAVQSLLAV